MEGITTLINETIFGLCLLLLIPSLAAAMHLRRIQPTQPAPWFALLIFSALLFAVAVWALVTLPMFDFVDRCRPPGTGMCVDLRPFEAARREILGEQILVVVVFLLLPLGLGAGGLYRFLQKRPRRLKT